MQNAAATRDYGFTLMFIASLILVAGTFGTSDGGPFLSASVAVVCATAGYGVLRGWVWAKWLAIAWGPLVIVVGVVFYWLSQRPISALEYVAGFFFAVGWAWDANRRLTLRSKADAQ
jgi:hypothetical protein